MPVDAVTLRTVMGRFTTGVAVVSSIRDGKPVAMTANSLTSVSLDPPLILFCGVLTSSTLAGVRQSGFFGLSILHEDQEHVARYFASSGTKTFDDFPTLPNVAGAPLLKECAAVLACKVHALHEGGDHEIVVGEVQSVDVMSDRPPLVFYRSGYHTLTL